MPLTVNLGLKHKYVSLIQEGEYSWEEEPTGAGLCARDPCLQLVGIRADKRGGEPLRNSFQQMGITLIQIDVVFLSNLVGA